MARHENILSLPPALHFEPGIHPIEIQTQNSELAEVGHGDIDVHVWNDAVCERLRVYRPSILAIDSLEPFDPDQNGNIDIDYLAKSVIWWGLPGRPSQINGTNEIIVVAADNTYNEPNPNSTKEEFLRIGTFVTTSLIGGTAGAFIDEYIYQAKTWYRDFDHVSGQFRDPNRQGAPRINRRLFFQVLGLVASIAALKADSLAPYSPWRGSTIVETDVDNVLADVSLDRLVNYDHDFTYINGRTALLISKMRDIMNMKPRVSGRDSSIGSVVMGSTHSTYSNHLMVDPEMRDEFIRAHAELMMAATKYDHTSFEGHWTDAQKRQWLKQHESTIQFFKVTEPDDKLLRESPRAEIERTVKFHGQVQSPSVQRAIRGLH